MGIVRWIWHGIVGLFSATLMWFMAVTWPVLLVMLRLLIPIVILVLLLEWLMGGSPSLDIWIEWILVVLIIGTALLLVQPITAPIVRYSLRMAPLPLGESARSSSVLGLALPWLIVFLILWTAEWTVRAIVVLVGVLGIWKSWEIRRRWKGEPAGEIVLFLRRFDKSADRTIGTAVRQVVPENKQLVFLMGNRPVGPHGILSWSGSTVSTSDGTRNRFRCTCRRRTRSGSSAFGEHCSAQRRSSSMPRTGAGRWKPKLPLLRKPTPERKLS